MKAGFGLFVGFGDIVGGEGRASEKYEVLQTFPPNPFFVLFFPSAIIAL